MAPENEDRGASRNTLIDVRGLSVRYGVTNGVRAVREVDLRLARGEVLGIAGESGSGKSTLAFAVARLLRAPAEVTSGTVQYFDKDGVPADLLRLTPRELKAYRWEKIAVVFQSALNALNPVLTIGAQLEDVLRAHRPRMTRKERRDRVAELLSLVGIASSRAKAFPHELSGGMRQRSMIAMALALEPEVIIMDEPTTALDVVTQRSILGEIKQLQQRIGFSIVFITHDLSLLLEIADRVAVMYAGRIVETGTPSELLESASHPYTVGLVHSFPVLAGERQTLLGIPGTPPDLRRVREGCSFADRCRFAVDACRLQTPSLDPAPGRVAFSDHAAACIRADQVIAESTQRALAGAR